MGFTAAVRAAFSKYFKFSGRSRRAEFWWFSLFLILAGIVAGIIDVLVFGVTRGPFNLLFAVATIVPTFSVQVRRLHDTDRGGWWVLLNFLPIIGTIILIIWYCAIGTKGDNRFGPDPLGSVAE